MRMPGHWLLAVSFLEKQKTANIVGESYDNSSKFIAYDNFYLSSLYAIVVA